jgi:hypothetical protein
MTLTITILVFFIAVPIGLFLILTSWDNYEP